MRLLYWSAVEYGFSAELTGVTFICFAFFFRNFGAIILSEAGLSI